ncbi:alkylhydroperoxidase-related (seleno)protein, partial [Streptomyces sp. NPDC059525]
MTAPEPEPGDPDELVPLAAGAVARLVALDTQRGATAAVAAVREAVRPLPQLSAAPDALRGLG